MIPPHKLLQTQTMQMTVLLANTPTQAKSCRIVRSRQQWPPMRVQTKWSTFVLIKMETSPHEMVVLFRDQWTSSPQKQHLINWKWYQYVTSKGMDCNWQVINHMEIYPVKQNAIFSQAVVVSFRLNWCTTWMLTKHMGGKKARWELYKNVTSHI